MYARTAGCPYITVAKRVLNDHAIPYREIFIDKDPAARQRVLDWTGFLAVPTLVITHNGDALPIEEPTPLPKGSSPRGIDRGWMITEPNMLQFTTWLEKHGLISLETG
jgi:glutaredoxin